MFYNITSDFSAFSEIQLQNNSMEDINKFSSKDLLNRDIGKKELPIMITYFVSDYSALPFYRQQRETRKRYKMFFAF